MIVEINVRGYLCTWASPTQPAPAESPRAGTQQG